MLSGAPNVLPLLALPLLLMLLLLPLQTPVVVDATLPHARTRQRAKTEAFRPSCTKRPAHGPVLCPRV